MTLHPQARVVLDLVAAAGEITPSDANLADIRTGFASLVMMGAGAPEAVAEVRDLEIAGPAGPVPVRVYRPSDETPLPVVVFFHGGGWTIGGIDDYDPVARQIANCSGAIVASVGYRLAPEDPHPAALDDCWAATTWIAGHAAEFGGDPARFALMGDSAGGNIAAVLAQRCAREGGPRPALQVLVYPVVDSDLDTGSYRENGAGYLLDLEQMRWFFDCYGRGGAALDDPTIAPLRAADLYDGRLRGLAPALVITAGYDPLRDEGEAYAVALRAAGVEVVHMRYDGMIHAFFGLGAVFDDGRAAVVQSGAALRAAFGTL
ncbi:MAG: acetyl esterase [Actinomycetota bacterium]|nr:acetyl esterase [Actinomycetota bacterium]